MADIATLVQRYLSLSAKPKRLNLYTVLGLDELSVDRTAIAAAIESSIKKLQSADRASDPAGFEQVVKIVRQARATLLDDEKKRTYDAQLRTLLTKKVASVEVSSVAANESRSFTELFPAGDPMAPFSMSDFLKQSLEQPEYETAAERHIAIAELSRSSRPNSLHLANQTVTEAEPPRQSVARPEPMNEWLDRPASGKNAGRELQEMIRRNRRKKNRMATGVAIGGSLLVLLVGAWMFISNRMEQNRQLAKNKSNASLANVFQPNAVDSSEDPSSPATATMPAEKKPPSRMDLGVKSQSTEDLGSLPKLAIDDQPATMPTSGTEPVAGTEPMKPSPPVVPEVPAMVPDVPATVPEKVPEKAPETKMVDDKPSEPPTEEEKAKWVEAMNMARKSMIEKNFEKFAKDIEVAIALSATDAHEEQARRLDKFGQLFEKGLGLSNEAFSVLKSSDEIKYGSSGGKAAVVESTENLLVLRISGKNERFTYDKIPMGIMMAVVEPKLNDNAVDHAIRGVMLSADTRSNSANKKQAKIHFEKAASMDKAFANLESVLEEKYQ
jgi:hypothetical protein